MASTVPGPGLAVRVIGEITEDKLEILRDADAIFREEIANAGLERDINQYFAVITDMRSVGVMGDGRTYDYTLAFKSRNHNRLYDGRLGKNTFRCPRKKHQIVS